ncbi:hypothetical protein EMIHUDRAFT_205511 [Emiliania huxleyi CCMP1516]|uniref:Selenoprotein F/M domain-containing protein n=2 Tax=Emiliania huxleyi TaxID=2903 RepID=A0A0D3JSI0_EMIH1|nr:hypothetical protein EMIHUDRAFT_205511 [Emiliania huxleyi CCMP1516]EOD26465.1 hypothetical protein EMIHUDRAFT_205511 [Emiliania huxleyi CCMP1516]|eukprot:XP_005778894.1 hypothetical protein EMIHUDRAFT_205511 [Emiliania huxleyi CCMP1516]
MLSGAVLTLLAASAAKKAAGGGGCEVTSTWPDGRVEQRQLRRYLKQDEGWKEWEGLEMQWIRHHNPDLVVLDDNGREKARVDLNGYDGPRVEALLEKHGFKRK